MTGKCQTFADKKFLSKNFFWIQKWEILMSTCFWLRLCRSSGLSFIIYGYLLVFIHCFEGCIHIIESPNFLVDFRPVQHRISISEQWRIWSVSILFSINSYLSARANICLTSPASMFSPRLSRMLTYSSMSTLPSLFKSTFLKAASKALTSALSL